jgi:anti-anti-sigma factor
MHLRHKRVQAGRSVRSDTVWRGDRDWKPRSTRAPLAVAHVQPDRGRLWSIKPTVGDKRKPVAGGQLVVAWEGRGEALIVWLSGTLDRMTGRALDRELDPRAIGTTPLVIDLTGLEFIDSGGMHTLARILRRATKRGDRLTFRHGQHVALRPLGLIRAVQLRSKRAPRPEPLSDEDSYLALANAIANVGRPRPGDRPWAA